MDPFSLLESWLIRETSFWILTSRKERDSGVKPAVQYIYRQMYCVHLYGLHAYCALVDLDSSGSSGVRLTPGLISSTQVVGVCVRAYTNTHPPTTLTPTKIDNYTRQPSYLYLCQNIVSHTSNKHQPWTSLKKTHFQFSPTHACRC